MPDKKLTDSEIVKALECCKYEYDTKCELCCYNFYSRTGCRGELRRNALDLINRLQEENNDLKRDTIPKLEDSLKRANKYGIATDKENQQLKAEIERFKDYATTVEKEVEWYKDELRHSDKKVATKAYKEVFEKLKDKSIVCKVKLYGKGKFFPCLSAVTMHDIKSLEKELVGNDA